MNTSNSLTESQSKSDTKSKLTQTPTTQQLFAFFSECDLHLSLIFPRNILLDTSKYEIIQKKLNFTNT